MTPHAQTTIKQLHAPKLEETEKDYQDHFNCRVQPTTNPMVCAAIADGATDSAFAARWAQELTRLFVESPPLSDEGRLSDLSQWLKPAQAAWHDSITWERVPWHGIDKARRGAAATFLGLTIQPADDGRLKLNAVAVGDCELIIIDSEDQVTMKFPVAEAADFNNRPDLICSNPKGNERIDAQIKLVATSICLHDYVILTTDAIAEWLLREETSPATCRQIAQMDAAEFAAWLQYERSCGRIKNDDATIAIITFANADPTHS